MYMFYKDRGIDVRLVVQGIRPALLEISTLPPGTFWDFHFTTWHYGIPTLPPAGRKKVAFQRFDRHRI